MLGFLIGLGKRRVDDFEHPFEKRRLLAEDRHNGAIRAGNIVLGVEEKSREYADNRQLAEDAKVNCPVSKLFNAEMQLTVKAGAPAAA